MDTPLPAPPTLAAAGVGSVPALDLPDETVPLDAALTPGGATPSAPAPVAQTTPPAPASPPPRMGLRAWLLTGAAAFGVLATLGAGVGVYVYRTRHLGQPATDWLTAPQAVSPQAPFGSPAQPPAPTPDAPSPAGAWPGPGAPAGRTPAPLPGPQAAVPAPALAPFGGADDLRALKPGAAPTGPAPVASAQAPSVPEPHEGAATAPPAAVAQPEAKPATPAPAPQPAPQPAPDPAKVATALTAAPMAAQDQVDVVNLVTQLAGVIAQERQESAELRERLAHLPEDVERHLQAFERRLSLAEAGAALGQARAAGKAPTQAVAPTAGAPPAAPQAASPLPARAAAGAAARRYEIRAASPGLAVLGTLDGTPAVKEIAVGDQVPGYGRVNAIVQQKGGAWVVQCDHGTIQ